MGNQDYARLSFGTFARLPGRGIVIFSIKLDASGWIISAEKCVYVSTMSIKNEDRVEVSELR
jgi:hypothetical protein